MRSRGRRRGRRSLRRVRRRASARIGGEMGKEEKASRRGAGRVLRGEPERGLGGAGHVPGSMTSRVTGSPTAGIRMITRGSAWRNQLTLIWRPGAGMRRGTWSHASRYTLTRSVLHASLWSTAVMRPGSSAAASLESGHHTRPQWHAGRARDSD